MIEETNNKPGDLGEEKVKELQLKCDEYLAGWKRALADYQNLRKEVAAEKESLGKFALASAALTFVPIYDNFKTAFSHAPALDASPESAKFKQWLDGVEHIKKQMSEALMSLGVEEIKTVGEKFDARFHETAGEEAVEGQAAGEIIREVSGGYKIGDKVIKAARVIVAS